MMKMMAMTENPHYSISIYPEETLLAKNQLLRFRGSIIVRVISGDPVSLTDELGLCGTFNESPSGAFREPFSLSFQTTRSDTVDHRDPGCGTTAGVGCAKRRLGSLFLRIFLSYRQFRNRLNLSTNGVPLD